MSMIKKAGEERSHKNVVTKARERSVTRAEHMRAVAAKTHTRRRLPVGDHEDDASGYGGRGSAPVSEEVFLMPAPILPCGLIQHLKPDLHTRNSVASSTTSALLATLIQRWTRRYIRVTLPQLAFDFTDDRSRVDMPLCRMNRDIIQGSTIRVRDAFECDAKIFGQYFAYSKAQSASFVQMAETRRKNLAVDWRISSGTSNVGVSCKGRELPKGRMVKFDWREQRCLQN